MSKTLEKVMSGTPINKMAALVTGKGVEYKSPKVIQNADQREPIPTRVCPKRTPKLKGKRRGRLTVIGVARDVPKRWVVRCDCGIYTIRTQKAINNPKNNQDRCEECRHLAYLKRTEYWRRTGVDKPLEEF